MPYKSKLVLALLAVYIVWGSTYMAMKITLATLSPLLTVGLRFTIGGTLLLLFTYWKEKKLPDRAATVNALYTGFLLTGIGNCGTSYAINYIPTGIVALISATTPLWFFLLNLFFFDKAKPTLRATIGVGMGLLGMAYLLNPFEKLGQPVPLWPAAAALIGSISWAYGSLKSRNLKMPSSPLQSTALQMLSGGLFGFLCSFLTERGQATALANSGATTFLALAYLIFLGSFVGFTAYLWLINNADPQLASTYAYVNPIIAIILGAAFLNESLSDRTIWASAIILTGVALMTFRRQKHFGSFLMAKTLKQKH
jgi:drug/metabolite transporter (DMT)-like permease